MASPAEHDLISLADDSECPVLPTSTTSIANRLDTNHNKPVQRDSFSDLTSLMKAKKPYSPAHPNASPSPKQLCSFKSACFQPVSCVSSSIPSPLAHPYHPKESVVATLNEKSCSPVTAVTEPTTEYGQQDIRRLEIMLKEIESFPIDEDNCDTTTVEHARTTTFVEPLLPGFNLPAVLHTHTDLVTPTSTESVGQMSPEASEPTFTLNDTNDMTKDFETLVKDKGTLETDIARPDKQDDHRSEDSKDELHKQIGKLQYQIEANKVHKATLARKLPDKDIQIKTLQLELKSTGARLETLATVVKKHAEVAAERDYLRATLRSDTISNSSQLAAMAEAKDREIQALSEKVDDLQRALKQSMMAQGNFENQKSLAQNRLEQLDQREKILQSTQEKYANEHMRVGELECVVKDLRRKLSQVRDLEGMLREKKTECDRFRTKLKHQENTIEDYKHRTLRASNNGKALRGAAHLVLPQPCTKLPMFVLGCSECYAKNITCDNKARCRHCTESNEKCARWRCSLKHILGECPEVPCCFPHETDGWLLQAAPRPEW